MSSSIYDIFSLLGTINLNFCGKILDYRMTLNQITWQLKELSMVQNKNRMTVSIYLCCL